MAFVHPSREKLVSQHEGSSDGSDRDRERELRQRLERSRAAKSERRQEDVGRGRSSYNQGGRASPTYDAHEGHQTSRNAHFDERRKGTNDLSGFYESSSTYYEDRNGVPPPGAWGRRTVEDGRAPSNAMGGDRGFFESRQEQRKHSSITIWPPSPTSPFRSEEEVEQERRKRKTSSRHKSHSDRHDRSKRHRSRRQDSEEYRREDEEDRRRRRHHRMHARDRSRERERRKRSVSLSESDEDRQRRKRRERERERHRERESDDEKERGDDRYRRHGHRSSRHESDEPDQKTRPLSKANEEVEKGRPSRNSDSIEKGDDVDANGHSSTSARKIGPQLPAPSTAEEGRSAGVDLRAYGKALLPGEGTAMANFVQEGQRIPRRGEIGLSSDQIEAYEKAGFVMSGSRHQRMNAVRMRKENQIYSAEEQRAMLKLIAEEKQKKEATLIEQFKDLVDSID